MRLGTQTDAKLRWGPASPALCSCYRNQSGGKTAEFMEPAGSAKVIRVVANYSTQANW